MMASHRAMILAAALSTLPVSALWAQSSSSSTADHSRLGGQTGAPVTPSPGGVTASGNSQVPGATGRTVVPGSNSTVSGDRNGTALGKTGGLPSGGGEGAGGGGSGK